MPFVIVWRSYQHTNSKLRVCSFPNKWIIWIMIIVHTFISRPCFLMIWFFSSFSRENKLHMHIIGQHPPFWLHVAVLAPFYVVRILWLCNCTRNTKTEKNKLSDKWDIYLRQGEATTTAKGTDKTTHDLSRARGGEKRRQEIVLKTKTKTKTKKRTKRQKTQISTHLPVCDRTDFAFSPGAIKIKRIRVR